MPTSTYDTVRNPRTGRLERTGTKTTASRERTSSGGRQLVETKTPTKNTDTISGRQEQEAIDRINQQRIEAGKPQLVGTNPPPSKPAPTFGPVQTMSTPTPATIVTTQNGVTTTTPNPQYYVELLNKVKRNDAQFRRETAPLPTGTQGPESQQQYNERQYQNQQRNITSPILNRPVSRAELEANQASAARIEEAKAQAREEDRQAQVTEYQRLKTRDEYVQQRQAERDIRNEAGGVLTILSRTEKKYSSEGPAASMSTRALARGADALSYYGTYRPVEYIERKAREGNKAAKAVLFTAELGKAGNQLIIDTAINPESIALQGAGEVAFRSAAQGYQEIKFIGKKELPNTEIISEQFLKGKEFYPKATPQQTVTAAKESGIVYSSAPARFNSGKPEVISLTNQARIKAGLATSKEETGGIFAAPKASPGFTRLVSKGASTEATSSESILRIPTLGNTATINRIETGAARLPKQYRGNLAKGNLFLDTEAAVKYPGKAFSSPLSELGKTESEVIIPGGSVLKRGNKLNPIERYSFFDRITKRDFEYYTKVPKVFGEPEAGLQKVAIRDYTNVGAKANKALIKGETQASKNRQFTTARKAYSSSAGREASSGILPLITPSARLTSSVPSSSSARFGSNTNYSSFFGSKSTSPNYSSRPVPSSSITPSYSITYKGSSYTPPSPPPSRPYPRYTEPPYPSVVPPSRNYPKYSETPYYKPPPLPNGFTAGVGGGGIGGRGSQTQRGGSDKFSYAPTFTAAFFGIKASKKQRKAILEGTSRGATYTGSEVIRPLL